MNMLQKKNNLSIIVSIFLVLAILISCLVFFLTNHNYDEQGANIKNFDSVSIIISTTPINIIEQKFQSKNNNLDKIYFYVNNKNTNNNLELSLVNNLTNEVMEVTDKKIQKSDITQLIIWDFDNNQNSKNIEYSLIIIPSINDGFELISTPNDRYEEGELFINGEKNDDSILAFSFDYFSNNLFPILYNRLSIYKPGIFNTPASFIILFSLILIMVFYTTYLIINTILTE
ncbi:MAG: hypothetical protein Q8P20_09175 [bacterium]|nr:hypothetical protein [bacterium]